MRCRRPPDFRDAEVVLTARPTKCGQSDLIGALLSTSRNGRHEDERPGPKRDRAKEEPVARPERRDAWRRTAVHRLNQVGGDSTETSILLLRAQRGG